MEKIRTPANQWKTHERQISQTKLPVKAALRKLWLSEFSSYIIHLGKYLSMVSTLPFLTYLLIILTKIL